MRAISPPSLPVTSTKWLKWSAICDPECRRPGRASARRLAWRLAEFEHHERLLAEVDVDAVAIASANHTHKEITVAAARRRQTRVLREGDGANSVPECWQMVRACEAADVRLMVGHKRRFGRPGHRMIELREQLGPVLAISSCLYHDARPYDYQRMVDAPSPVRRTSAGRRRAHHRLDAGHVRRRRNCARRSRTAH